MNSCFHHMKVCHTFCNLTILLRFCFEGCLQTFCGKARETGGLLVLLSKSNIVESEGGLLGAEEWKPTWQDDRCVSNESKVMRSIWRFTGPPFRGVLFFWEIMEGRLGYCIWPTLRLDISTRAFLWWFLTRCFCHLVCKEAALTSISHASMFWTSAIWRQASFPGTFPSQFVWVDKQQVVVMNCHDIISPQTANKSSSWKCLRHYLKTWFIIDIVVVFWAAVWGNISKISHCLLLVCWSFFNWFLLSCFKSLCEVFVNGLLALTCCLIFLPANWRG